MRVKWPLVLAGLVIAVAARAVDMDARHLVRPGEGIGVIKLGMTVPQVHEAMAAWGAEPLVRGASGGPGAWVDEKSGSLIEGYQTDALGRGRYGNVMKIFYVKNRVAQIAVQSTAYATTKGAVTRMTSREWRSLHPSLNALPVEESWGGKVRAYDSPTQGLAVTFNVLAGNREAMSAQEVIVHPSGTPVRFESPRRPAAGKPEGTSTGTPAGPQTAAPAGAPGAAPSPGENKPSDGQEPAR
jgi:hypothetical protein